MIYRTVLPFPPSVNSAYGNRSNQRRFKSKQYKAWLSVCPDLILPDTGIIDHPVCVTYTFFMPDRRARDIDNYVKVVCDYLVSQGVLEDDNHKIIAKSVAIFGGIDTDNPRVEICISDVKTGTANAGP